MQNNIKVIERIFFFFCVCFTLQSEKISSYDVTAPGKVIKRSKYFSAKVILQIHLWILHLICKIQKLDIGTSARILLIDRQKCAQFYGIGFNKTMYKMLNYRKKTAAASLAGLNLERPIQVRTIFCYIFHFSCRSRKNSQPLWHSVASQKKLRMHLELGHLALRRTESCSLAIRVKNAFKKKSKRMT